MNTCGGWCHDPSVSPRFRTSCTVTTNGNAVYNKGSLMVSFPPLTIFSRIWIASFFHEHHCVHFRLLCVKSSNKPSSFLTSPVKSKRRWFCWSCSCNWSTYMRMWLMCISCSGCTALKGMMYFCFRVQLQEKHTFLRYKTENILVDQNCLTWNCQLSLTTN